METLVSLGCTPDGENILRKKSAAGVLLERIEQPKEGLFPPQIDRVEQLARTIKADGLIYPVLLMELPGPFPTMHEILDGQHRVAAVRRLHAEACASQDPEEIGKWNRIPAIIVNNLDSEKAKNLYRIKANLERNEYSDAEKAELLAELRLIEPYVRGGETPEDKMPEDQNYRKTVVSKTGIGGRGKVSPFSQYIKDLGKGLDWGRDRYKTFDHPDKLLKPSEMEGNSAVFKAFMDYCVQYLKDKESEKKAGQEERQRKERDARARAIANTRMRIRDALLELREYGESLPGMDAMLADLGVSL